ncbi:hypothetical protein [Brevundimonas goettingensis]|uniref:Uncharacterized protein n=1 Tax=Brevundimonas goettingensis TaxID=2774190 RepID=A0A975GUS4_9CAUL|nr:hypothetical protein [Brevundimonas goettingensis]QTC89724.1 hypothetical protein IFJ75_10395 [Brevundimonas goettingensis]
MPKVVWKHSETGVDLMPPVEATQAEVDAMVCKIELGEEIYLRRENLKDLNLVVLTIDTAEGVTTLSAQPV